MLIRVFEVPHEARTSELKERIMSRLSARFGFDREIIKVSFSPLRTDAHPKLRILVTGITREQHVLYRKIVSRAGWECRIYFWQLRIPWRGFENPQTALPDGYG